MATKGSIIWWAIKVGLKVANLDLTLNRF